MELRILSGLHRGAVMELDDDAPSISIGSSAGGDADVLLADAGISKRHCQLLAKGTGWTLEPAQGKILDAQGRGLTSSTEVTRGQVYKLAEVWIGFFEAEDPWQDSAAPAAARTAGYPRIKAPLIAVALLTFALPAVWFVSTAWGRGTSAASTTAAEVLRAPAPAPEAPASPAKLAEEFTRALEERELRDRLDLQLAPDRWEIRGSLDGDERQRFERLLVRFTESRQPSFPIKVSLVTPDELLPFTVVEVITGKGAGVVTNGGERLQVGDALQGWKLMSVDAGKVVFQGRQRVEVTL